MKGGKRVVIVLVLFASLLCAAEAARRKDSSTQNSFRRAANGIYQTLSNVFGEDNIRGLYKVSELRLVAPALPQLSVSVQASPFP